MPGLQNQAFVFYTIVSTITDNQNMANSIIILDAALIQDYFKSINRNNEVVKVRIRDRFRDQDYS